MPCDEVTDGPDSTMEACKHGHNNVPVVCNCPETCWCKTSLCGPAIRHESSDDRYAREMRETMLEKLRSGPNKKQYSEIPIGQELKPLPDPAGTSPVRAKMERCSEQALSLDLLKSRGWMAVDDGIVLSRYVKDVREWCVVQEDGTAVLVG